MNYFLFLHVIALLVFFFLSTVSARPGGRLVWVGNPFVIVFCIYIFSGLAAFFVPEDMLVGFNYSAYGWDLYLAYSLLICLVLSPAILLKGQRFNFKDVVGKRLASRVYALSSVAIWISFVYQIPYALSALSMGAQEVRHGMNVLREGILPASPLTTFSVVTSSFYVLFIFMFFYAVANRLRWIYVVSTFFGGALYVISSICFTARDGPLFYVLTMGFAYYLFRDDLPENVRKRLARIISLSGGVIVSFLIVFTAQRFFADGDLDELLGGTLGYIGQQPFVFSETIISQNQFYGFDLRFPLISLLLTGVENEIVRTDPFEWSFGTFLKDYYAMFGWDSLIALSFLQTVVFFLAFSRRVALKTLPLIMLVGFYFQFMVSGVFYFRLGTRGGNLYMILYFLLVLAAIFYRKKRTEVLS